MEHLRIGIIGNIGVGKSTFTEAASTPPLSDIILSELPDRQGDEVVHVFHEKINQAVLEQFYEDRQRYALLAQIEFFNGRYERQLEIGRRRGIILEDTILAVDYHIYGKAQRIQGKMTEAEFLAYQRTYRNMSVSAPNPDLVVYLRADVPTLMERIRRRTRPGEELIEEQYLVTLNMLYEEFIADHLDCPYMVINADNTKTQDEFNRMTVEKIADRIRTLNLRVTTPGISKWVSAPLPDATVKAIEAEHRLREYLAENPKLITIAGNIGLGKTTLARLLEHGLGVKALLEKPEENPLLEKFLADKAGYCYQLQRHFLDMRAGQRRHAKSSGISYIKDRSLGEDILCFSDMFREQGYLTADEFDLLGIEYKRVSRELPPADLMIILKGDPDLAWSRIVQRGREMELEGGWQRSDVLSLDRRYRTYADKAIAQGYHKGPVLIVDLDMLDLTNRIHMGYVCEQIHKKLKDGK